ncbi:response regulator [Candidatus Bathycorpusculum sp.]|uniref:response regulator n=1 Tax=Candidatus Bathycorpusculum sp. TaxID=2994959 RepID=UPI0031CCB1C5
MAYYTWGFLATFISNQPSILIIDDDPAILRTFMRIFQKKGYSVAVAARGGEAIEKLNRNNFDVALIDFCLPDMEGTKLFPMIEHNSPRTLKIMWSGKIVEPQHIAGADALLGKPIHPDKLLSIIESKLKNRNIEL